MRTSQLLLTTTKETPADAEIISHQLMLRAGMIKRVASGVYTWLPVGLRVLRKVENIVREEMNRIGAQELLMPAIQPAELWQESGRWETYGDLLLKITDNKNRDYCYGPTHEEVITDLARNILNSYKQLPCCFYQIQTKFRDEIRPRFGVMRAREFIMKDAYSFHLTEESLQETYDQMFGAYQQVFTRLGLKFRPVLADGGSIGGSYSHEFHVLANTGEDILVASDGSDYAANIERAQALAPTDKRATPNAAMEIVDTPNQKTIEQVCQLLNVEAKQTVKTLVVKGEHTPLVALVLRGDHTLNEIKAEKLPQVASPLQFASDEEIKQYFGCDAGSIGPRGIDIPVIADRDAAQCANFICGANQNGKHYIHVNWARDLAEPEMFDIRNVVEGDLSPDGKGKLFFSRGVEVGHIFQLGDKYTHALNANVLNEHGKQQTMIMGCYGIGVSRIVAAAIEQNNDANGIIWPTAMAPFQCVIAPINYHKSPAVKDAADNLYQQLTRLGIEVLLDDRNERPGIMFADAELMGIPHRIVIGDKDLAQGQMEYKRRYDGLMEKIALNTAVNFIQQILA